MSLWPLVAGAVVLGGACFLIWLGFRAARKQGALEIELDGKEKAIDAARTRIDVEEEARRLGDTELRARLLDGQ